MRTPTPQDMVRVWEMGREKPGWYRGLLMLAPAFPALRFHDLASWPIGRRNIALYKLRGLLFGPDMTALAKCPNCGGLSELPLKVGEICPHEFRLPGPAAEKTFPVAHADREIRCRRLTSEDLAAVQADLQPTDPRLLIRALAAEEGAPLPRPLEPALQEKIADALYEHDPMLELVLCIDCVECGHEWGAPFDIAGFVWTELVTQAVQMLGDVHQLAQAYGWREADILGMSAARRRFYIDRTLRDPVRS